MSTELYRSFQLEIVKSEIQRTKVLLGAFSLGLTAVIVNYFFLDEKILKLYGANSYLLTLGWLIIFIVYELLIFGYFKKIKQKGKDLSRAFRTIHSFVEISFPSVIIFYNIEIEGQLGFIDSPAFLLYFLFIILSILHLDLRLSLFTGFHSAIQYLFLIYYGFHYAAITPEQFPNLPENSFYMRVVIFAISGAAGGFVANELQKRIRATFELSESKSQMERLFGQQVSREVVQALIEDDQTARKQEATVLALDIRNFSVFAEQRSPDEILEFQNKIFGPILEIINQHQGIVLQIMGDGVMATFGTPVQNPLHADMAFQAALAIVKKLKELNDAELIPHTRVGIGLHTGEVIMGNIGNENRKQFSVSGTAVIVAFRVEQLNKENGSDFLITGEVKDRIAPGKNVITPLGLQTLKGFGTGIEVYKVG